MLNSMRTLTNSGIGKGILSIIMGFIMLSFVVWGIGPVFNGFGAGNLAKVGSSEITTAAYSAAFKREVDAAQQQARRIITQDEARRFGLDRLALNKMIADSALDQKAKALSLGMSNESVAKIIGTDPSFKGPSGQFDKKRFDDAMRNAGFSENEFVAEEKRAYLRREITTAITGNSNVPDVMLDMVHAYSLEQRTVEYLILPASSVGTIAPPDDEALKTFFEARKAEFRAPEYRAITMLALSPATSAKPDTVSDADAAALYERVKDKRFTAPETRKLEQIVVPTEADAKSAQDKLKSGTTFAALAEELKLKPIDLGVKQKTELFDKAIADAAFALPANGVTDPVKTTLGYALVHAVAITPAAIKTLAETTPALKQELAAERAKADIQTLHDKIEDARSSGKPLAEAAKAAGAEVVTFDAIDTNGLDKAGKPLLSISEPVALMKAVFASDVGVDNETILNRDGGFTWFEIQKIEPSRERSLDEVKDRVIAAWTEAETAKKLTTLGSDTVKKLNDGKSLDDISNELGKLTINSANITRSGKTDLAANFVVQAFNVPVGGAGTVSLVDGTRAVFKVAESKVPPLDKTLPAVKDIAQRIKQSVADDVVTQYLGKLQNDIGVKINEPVYNQVIGQK